MTEAGGCPQADSDTSATAGSLGVCPCCERPVTPPHYGRGLCCSCYRRNRRQGTLDRYPHLRWGRASALVEDAEWVRRTTGGTTRQIAERLGVTYEALKKAQQRAKTAA